MNLSVLLIKNKLFVGIILSLLLFSCSSESPSSVVKKESNQKKIVEGIHLLKDGDLILRTGRSFISSALRRFSLQDQTYSHCGFVRKENGKTLVYHAIGGEDNPQKTLCKVPIKTFCNPKQNIGFGIFRYTLTNKQRESLDSLIDKYYKEQIPFDRSFDLTTNDAFYCTEFIYKTLLPVTSQNYLPTSHIGSFKYIAIDNLYLNKHTTSIYEVKFQ
ncbi:MAG TPA: hypothetical protein VK084_11905 [Chitinophagaceae bacterium]|nr:hypothetical protein [Chitinophagaceae bacterium]